MAFRLILWCIGVLLTIASRSSPRLRDQLTRNMVITIASRQGVARTFHVRERRVSSRAGSVESGDCLLTFPSASSGTRIFLASNAVERIVRGLSSGDIELRGLPAHVLWFYEMVVAFLPWRGRRRLSMPGSYTSPDPNGRSASRIVREPSVNALDPSQVQAIEQRAKLNIWRVGSGAPVPGRIGGFRHVVTVPPAESGKPT